MSKVTATDLPSYSKLHDRVERDDFLDCFSVASNMPARQATEIITEFPWWAKALLVVRRVVVMPFGLSNDGPEAEDKFGAFPLEIETNREVIAGFDDRHLDFRVSVISQDGRVYLATWVHPHNFGGRLYLKAILGFHILIARNALSRVAARQPAFQA